MQFQIANVPLPPRDMRNHADEFYSSSAVNQIRRLAEYVPLAPSMRVVDIGCAAGRLCLPLLPYLDPEQGGAYRGFEVRRDRVAWATANITERWPHVTFERVNVFSQFMNPCGAADPADLTFPVERDWADLVILHSVFTHMREPGIRRYTEEIVRMLRPDGELYVTMFLWNREASKAVTEGSAVWSFPHHEHGVRLQRLDKPELAVAITERLFASLKTDYGMRISHFHSGGWREGKKGGQDFAIFKKVSAGVC